MSSKFSYLSTAGKTDVGRVRKQNEDTIGIHPDEGWFCVADGMGGEEAGDKASALTVEALGAEFEKMPAEDGVDNLHTRKLLAGHAAIKANAHIRDFVRRQGLDQSGSTVVLLVFDHVQASKALVMHAGDSRIYRLRGGEFEQITTDHSIAEEAGVKDEKDIPLMFRGMVTRALGIKPVVHLECQTIDVERDDLYLACSDGLSGMVSNQELHLILGQRDVDTLETLAEQLIQAALAGGGKDNVSAVLVRVGELPEQVPGTLKMIDVPEDEEVLSLNKVLAQETEDVRLEDVLDVASDDSDEVMNPAVDDPMDPIGGSHERTDDFSPITPSDDHPTSQGLSGEETGQSSSGRIREKLKALFKLKPRDGSYGG
jgi:protein phosphatase